MDKKCMPLPHIFSWGGYHEVYYFLSPYPTDANARRTATDYNGRKPIACIPNFMYSNVS